MKVILLNDVKGLGTKDSVVNVSDGMQGIICCQRDWQRKLPRKYEYIKKQAKAEKAKKIKK